MLLDAYDDKKGKGKGENKKRKTKSEPQDLLGQ